MAHKWRSRMGVFPPGVKPGRATAAPNALAKAKRAACVNSVEQPAGAQSQQQQRTVATARNGMVNVAHQTK